MRINYSPVQIRYKMVMPYINYSNTMNNLSPINTFNQQQIQKSFSGVQIQNIKNNYYNQNINNSMNITNPSYLPRNYSAPFINNSNIQRVNTSQIYRKNSPNIPIANYSNIIFNNLNNNINQNTNSNANTNINNSLYTTFKNNNPNIVYSPQRIKEPNPNQEFNNPNIFYSPQRIKEPNTNQAFNNPNIFSSPQRIKEPNPNQEFINNLNINKTNQRPFNGPNISPPINQIFYNNCFPHINYNNIIIQNKNNNIRFNINQQFFINKDRNEIIEPKKLMFNTPKKNNNESFKEKLTESNNVSIKSNKSLNNSLNNIFEPKENFDPNEFIFIKRIGEGAYGKIYMAQWKKNNKKYAMKKEIIKGYGALKKKKEKTKIVTNFIKKTGNKGVIKIYGDLIKKKGIEYNYYILMEIAEKDWEKELFDRQKINKFYTEKEMYIIMNQLIKTLSLLQKNHITHRDIKPQNILISKGIYKLSDFGEARTLIREGVIVSRVRGTELYMSPILFNGLRMKLMQISHNTFKSDVFSLGMCLFFAATLTLNSIYNIRELNDMKLIRNQLIKELSGRYSYQLINILYEMLQIDENIRPDFITLEKKYFL